MNQKLDLGTIIGLVSGTTIIAISIWWLEGKFLWFFQWSSVFIVIGGVVCATLVNYPLKAVFNLRFVLKNVIRAEVYDFTGTIQKIIDLAEKSRKNGLLSLEADLSSIESAFLRDGVELAINEREASRLRTFLSLDLSNISTRHVGAQEIILYMAAYSPAFGMLGTVIGLIVMMNRFQMGGEVSTVEFNVAEQFKDLLAGMGTALITTFYGVLLANLVFLPIAGKLKRQSENEIMLKSIVLEGIISIHAREHPLLIREKLMTFVALSERDL